jgi:hypothetical protein
MDRWNHYGTWSEFERRLAQLIPSSVEVAIFAILVLSLFGGRALHCASVDGAVQSCMHAGMHNIVGRSLHGGAVLLGIWAGPRIGLRLQRYWLGYLAGALITLAAMASLVLLGFPIIGT